MTTTSKSNDPDLLREAGELIRATLKELLEKKHLYQSMSLSEDDFWALVKRSLVPTPDAFRPYLNSDWYCAHSSSVVSVEDKLWFKVPDVKLFCKRCDRLEAFNSVGLQSFFQDCYDKSQPVQVFAFSFLCQSCKSIPEVFIVRRAGLKLTLCGRAPIEHVEVPHFIPEPVQLYYRGGILAFQSGQTLAGNFMLRTLIEKWARLATGLEAVTKVDIVMDTYMDSLPKDFRDRFPSMRDLYAALSSDIHAALGSPDLFERAQKEIVEHFDARRLFKLRLTTAGA
jgi:hypothetical protein